MPMTSSLSPTTEQKRDRIRQQKFEKVEAEKPPLKKVKDKLFDR